ncbi:MAG: lyase family protein [Aigarchaeota archaeon]|nr:lyase family protein [Aigarchaeota archaeon]MDW8092413.1 lyase family protein [Nitrososphaerota archaeon]
MIDPLHAVSPIDGRYSSLTSDLSRIFSEYALIRYRLIVEVKYLGFLLNNLKISSNEAINKLRSLEEEVSNLSEEGGREVKRYEAKTSHDVESAVRYLKARLGELGLTGLQPYVHLGLTSEDVTNLSLSLMLTDFKRLLKNELNELMNVLMKISYDERRTVIVGRTHGQPAAPTTLGKEFAVHLYRLLRCYSNISAAILPGKISGSVGTYSALVELFGEDVDEALERFISSLGLRPWIANKQILPHDDVSRFLFELSLTCMVLVDLARDLWLYTMLGYLRWGGPQRVGSSTIPHKVNPIEVENAEGNLELASTLFTFLANRLLVSRLQRDLSDSTLKRNYGTAAAHMIIGIKNVANYLRGLYVDREGIRADVEAHPEVVSETVQVRLRKRGIDAIDRLRSIRSSGADYLKELREVITSLGLRPEDFIPRTVEECIGLSEKIVNRVNDEVVRVTNEFFRGAV